MEADKKKEQEAEWFALFELNDDKLEQLIENKFIRARQYHNAFRQRKGQDEIA